MSLYAVTMPMCGARSATTRNLSLAGIAGEGVRDVGAAQALRAARARAQGVDVAEVVGARARAAAADAFGDGGDRSRSSGGWGMGLAV